MNYVDSVSLLLRASSQKLQLLYALYLEERRYEELEPYTIKIYNLSFCGWISEKAQLQ